jgi:Phosphatidylglycerophosphate synthase
MDDSVPAPSGSGRILTLPNAISAARLVCIPVFLWLLLGSDHPAVAAWLLAGLGATDWIDGYLARLLDQGSDLGKILDPTADRLLLLAATVGIVAVGVPAAVTVFAVVVLAREALVAAATLALAVAGAKRIDVLWVGKAGTLAVMFSLPMLLLAAHVAGGWHWLLLVGGWGFGIPGIALGYYAAAKYVPAAREALQDGRRARLEKAVT